MDLIARSMILRAVISIALAGIAVWALRSVIAVAAAIACGRCATLLLYDLRRSRPPTALRRAPWSVFRSALPLGVVLMLVSLTTNVPRYAIEQHIGTTALGVFAAVASFVAVGFTMMNALGQSVITRLARHYSSGEFRQFRRLVLQLSGMAAGIGLVGALLGYLIGDVVLRLIYRPEYAVHQDLLIKVLVAGTFGYVAVMLGYAVTSTRAFAAQIPLFLASAAASAITSYLAVPQIGLSGAALAVGVAGCVQIVGALIILSRAL
jgi:O-antigen/teichoic acid export membrane protein